MATITGEMNSEPASLFNTPTMGNLEFPFLDVNGLDERFNFECSEEDVWIPMDQTIHWGKRPHSTYPQVRLLKDKSEIPKIPRGRHLVARLLPPVWEWDDNVDVQNRPDPSSTSCLEEEKTVVPFEKGVATFRHLRASKSIKLKGTESVIIRTLRVELGHHNAFDTVPFKSLDIFLSKTVRVHLVAHKRSVEIMQRHGLLPQMEITKKEKKEVPNNQIPASQPSPPLASAISNSPKFTEDQIATLKSFLPQLLQSGNEPQSPQQVIPAPSISRKRGQSSVTMIESEGLKKQKATLITDIFEEVSQIQQSIDYLGKRVVDFINLPTTTTIRIQCNPELYPPSVFVFYAFRTRDMGLALTMMSKAKDFDINTRDEKGYSVLHTAAKSGFLEGVMWCLFNGANVNATSINGCTPLHFAYQRNDKGVKKALKEAGANIEALNLYGMKPKDYKNRRRPLITHSLCYGGRVEVVMEGLEKPFPLTIWYAARIGWLEVVTMYIENLGSDVDTKNSNGQTPLMCAAEYSKTNVVEYLLREGADPNARDIHDRTPLHYAYICGNPYVLDMLSQAGADPNLNNIWRRAPSFYREGKEIFVPK